MECFRVLRYMVMSMLFCCAVAAQGVTFNPAGGSVSVGSTVTVTNNDTSPGFAEVRLDDGTLIASGWVDPNGGKRDIPIPNDASLIGRQFTVKVCTDQGCYEHTYTMTA